MPMADEIWKPISGYEGYYEVSTLGRVRGVDRTRRMVSKKGLEHTAFVKGVTIKPHYDSRGCYQIVGLNKNGKHHTRLVHRLVAETFIPNQDNLPEVNHIDEDKTNNAVSNLEWCDHLYNNRYGTKLTSSQGEKNAMNKFSEKTIRSIRSEYNPSSPDGTLTALSKKHGVSVPHVRSIVTGFRWGWLK